MSSSIESREVGSKEEFQDKGSVSTAKNWCNQARKILGLSARGPSRLLKATINGVTSDLKSLSELKTFAGSEEEISKKLNAFEENFKQHGWELKQLSELYEKYKLDRKNAKSKKEKRNIEAKMKGVQKKIQARVTLMQWDRDELHNFVVEEEGKQKEQRDKIKMLPDAKEIASAEKKWKTQMASAKKLVNKFSKLDSDTAKLIEEGYNQNHKRHNWLVVKNAGQADDYLKEATSFVEKWKKRSQDYRDGKKAYDGSKKEAREWMEKGQLFVASDSMSDLITRYYNGINAASRMQFDVAGKMINSTLITDLKSLVGPAAEQHQNWQTIRNDSYARIHERVEGLEIREYCQVALIQLANLVGLAETSKDYAAACAAYPAVEAEANRIVACDSKCKDEKEKLFKSCVDVETIVNGYDGEAATFANVKLPEIQSIRDQFVELAIAGPHRKSEVPTEETIAQIASDLSTKLKEINQFVDLFSTPEKVRKYKEQLEAKKDYRPLLETVLQKIEQAKNAVYAFKAFGHEPTDPKQFDKWNQVIEGTATYCQRRQRDLENEEPGDFDEVKGKLSDHESKLAELIRQIGTETTAANEAITTARNTLQQKIQQLEPLLKSSRWANFRQAKWNETAKAELEIMKIVVNTDNSEVLKDKATAAQKLIEYAKNVVEDPVYNEYFTLYQKKYNELKSRLSRLRKSVNKKAVKKILPQEQAKYGGKAGLIAALIQELRETGPGAMKDDHQMWVEKVDAMETEVQTKILNKLDALNDARKRCSDKIKAIKERLFGELADAVLGATGKVITPKNLPIMDDVLGCEGILSITTEVSGFDQLYRRLENINTQIDWLLQDGARDRFASLIKLDADIEKEIMESSSDKLGHQARYDLAKQHYSKAWDVVKKMNGVDFEEKKRILELYNVARKLARKKQWQTAAAKMDMAARMMHLLQNNPQGSGMTGRGRKNLSKLDVRWKGGVDTFLTSVTKLQTAIGESFTGIADINATSITNKFQIKVPDPFTRELPKNSFESELLVLQADPPKKSEAKAKDREKKKKYREAALVKVRQYKSLIASGPMYKAIMFSSNPWSKKDGNVNGLDLMRALNDLDLNIQRSVS